MCSFSNWFEKKLSRLLDPNLAMTNRILLLRMESAFPKWEMKHHIPTRIPCRSFAITLHFPLTECENKQPVLLFFWFVCFVSFRFFFSCDFNGMPVNANIRVFEQSQKVQFIRFCANSLDKTTVSYAGNGQIDVTKTGNNIMKIDGWFFQYNGKIYMELSLRRWTQIDRKGKWQCDL